MTTGEYKRYKGLTKQNLRDNMTNVELALNTLAEVATTEYSRQSNPQSMAESQRIAKEGGEVTLSIIGATKREKALSREIFLQKE